MSNQHDERSVRIERLKKIQKRGINPYPATTKKTHDIREMLDNFDRFLKNETDVTLAGRIISLRGHGGSTFIDLDDGSGQIQVYFKKDAIDSKADLSYSDLQEFIDTGDFIEVSGKAFLTQKKQRTLIVSSWNILSKAIQSIPSKWYGVKDPETRYRKRYLDLLMDPELRQLFFRKARFWNSMREFLITRGFLEVYTPILENTTGGADASPFVTHHNALDIDVYLRISMGELWQKRLMVAGYPKTFEIGRQFRNEGIDPEHLQDYTQMEYYWAYADYNQGMELTKELIRHVAQETYGTLEFKINGTDVDLGQEWIKINFIDEIKKQLKIDVKTASVSDIKSKLAELNVKYDDQVEKGRLMDLLWKKCRINIVGPAYLIGVPVEISPLAKRLESDSGLTQRFQLILAGTEVCNGYSELNDPLDQRDRFSSQAKLREAGDEEAQMNDEEFVEALEYGMPPVCGLGISERLFSFLENKSIRECVMFPLLRPKNSEQGADEKKNISKLSERDLGITRDEALNLLSEYISNKNLIKHHLAAETQMKALAKYFASKGEEVDEEAWALAGLLHDIDWEMIKDEPERHSLVAEDILNKKNVRSDIVSAVKVHNHLHKIEPETLMEKALYSAEELTGLVVATALVQPDKKLASVTIESVNKKFKDKSFARGVNREIILQSKDLLGIELDQLINITIKAMQKIASDLGL